jgi:tetratricopeptide (TPR) repeat protein/KaiC/GvpD/RAD55 family RecA-like ATPase
MPKPSNVKLLLADAEKKEKKQEWTAAAECYEKMLSLMPQKDFSRLAEIEGQLGHAYYRAAMQAKNSDQFRDKVRQAAASYGKAREICSKSSMPREKAKKLCYDAMTVYMDFWLALEVSERKRLLDECLIIERKALKAYEENEEIIGLGKTCIELAGFLSDRLDLELDMQTRESLLHEALRVGENAIRIFSEAGDKHELAKAYFVTSVNCYDGAMSLRLEAEEKECVQKAFEYVKEAIRISEQIGDDYLLGRSVVCLGSIENDLGAGAEAGSILFKKALQCCTETTDHRVTSEAFDGLAFSTEWSMTWEEDSEEFKEKSRNCEEYAGKAINHSTLINYSRGIFHSYGYGYVANLRGLSSRETKIEARHGLLKKAAALGRQGLEHAQRVGSTHAIFHVSSELAHALYDLATMETGAENRHLLLEAMSLGEKGVQYTEQLRPHYTLPKSIPYEALALIMLELSKLEEKDEDRRELLEKAVSRMETCIELCQRHVTSFPSRRELLALLGGYKSELGTILNQLYQTTAEKEVLRKLIGIYQNAAHLNERANLAGRAAEAYWRTAMVYDRLGEYLESANNFESASKQYKLSAEATPQLSSFYSDYVIYMKAWSYIEKAKHNHEKEEYGSSKEYYKKAATALNSSKSWIYLVPNYSAWSRLEQAEDLSRDNWSEQAILAFKEAAKLFGQAQKSIGAKSGEIKSSEEKDNSLRLVKASNIREEYCLSRIIIEEAKNLYTLGDCSSSAEKYGFAAEKLNRIARAMETEAELKELLPMIHMCQAWQKMSMAEETADATLYSEAAALFAKAKESSTRKRTAMLAAGDSSICKALELGAKYKSTRNVIFYYEAKHYMESASDYYMDAGFGNASTSVSATEALFDAYFYMDKAETEADHLSKTKLYGLVEGYLDRSAKLFNKAGYPKKAEDVAKTLERVKEKREFALSLDKVLVAPAVTSSTASIAVPIPSHEEAVGLERFEHADVQASLNVNMKDVKAGEDLVLGIDLVNAGKGYALLVKIEEIAPEDFHITEAPEPYTFEDSYLNMSGKLLGPLKTEEVKLTLRPVTKGVFVIKPRILYLDETGKYKSHEPEPVTITVMEPEISGWPAHYHKDYITTGYADLDKLLCGGIPPNYAVVLTSSSFDERDLLVNSFLETGAKKGEVTFYVTIDPGMEKTLAEEFPSSFYLFVCNPQADAIVKSAPNVFKLKGVENLTDINIALTSAIRKLDSAQKGRRRICIGLVSDVLLQHHAVQTRRWLAGLITELRSVGFTILATFDPEMHAPQEVRAILDLFEGEINIHEKETGKGSGKYLKIKKLSNQKYLEKELLLRKESLAES